MHSCFKWSEVVVCPLKQRKTPSSSTSPISDGRLWSRNTPQIQTRSQEPTMGKKSFLRFWMKICYIPWRGNRSVSPFFSFSSLTRYSWSVCKTKVNQFSGWLGAAACRREVHSALPCAQSSHVSSSHSSEPLIQTCRTSQISHSSFLPLPLPRSLTHIHTLSLSFSLFSHMQLLSVCFSNPFIEREDKNRSNFSPDSVSRQWGRQRKSECEWLSPVSHFKGVIRCVSEWFQRTITCAHLSACITSLPFIPLSCRTFSLPSVSPRLPALLQSVRWSVQCRAVRGAEDRGFMVFSPEEHLIQGQGVTFNWRMESLFPVMQPPQTHTHRNTHHRPHLPLLHCLIKSDTPASFS